MPYRNARYCMYNQSMCDMPLTYFLIFTAIFVLATMCFIKIAYFSIQPNQWFDLMFHHQARLDRWYKSGQPHKRYLTKIMGDCPMCFSNFLTFLSFWVYYFFCIKFLGFWLTDLIDLEANWRGIVSLVGLNLIWFVIYMCITAVMSTLFISKKE